MLLSFLNANWYRKYPFKSTAATVDLSGFSLPTDLIVGCRLMIDLDHCKVGNNIRVGVSKIYYNDGDVSIEFSSENYVLGYAKGTVTKDDQALTVTPIVPTFSGYVFIGNAEQLKGQGCYHFTLDTGELEPSTYTIYTPPQIKGLVHNGQRITGHVTFNPVNLTMDTSVSNINFTVLSPGDVASRMDLTSNLLTCDNPIIGGVNSVLPLPAADGKNNIDFFGIAPVTVTVVGGNITIGTEGIELDDICVKENIPPTDETSSYHEDITTTESPEWAAWPQYTGITPPIIT